MRMLGRSSLWQKVTEVILARLLAGQGCVRHETTGKRFSIQKGKRAPVLQVAAAPALVLR
jgi:hypothetical protein